MSKLKTKSAAKKRFKVTGSGRVRVKYGYKAHNLRKRPQQMKRQNRGMKTVTPTEGKKVKKHFLPYDH
jgi:large subunit ribosomal protein L35